MAVVIGLLLLCAALALERIGRALLTPLPEAVQCVFHLDDHSESDLEACVRGFRFLKARGMIRGKLIIELGEASAHARRAAQILARRGDISIAQTKE